MNHAECESLLAVYRDLEPAEREGVDRHLAGCPECAAQLEAYRRMDQDLRRLPDVQPHPRLSEAWQAAMERERGRRWSLHRLAGQARVAAQAGLVVALSLVGLLLAYVWTQPGSAPAPGAGAGPTPTLSTPGPGVADILADPPAPGETVELDAYYSGAVSFPFHGGRPPPDDQVVCPFNWAQALTDRPFAAMLALLNGYHGNSLPADEPWLVAVTPDAAEPGRTTMPQLPYHARLRGHLGEPALAHCEGAARIFVVEEVVQVYEETGPQAALHVPEDYANWPRHHDATLGYSLPYPPDWQVERQDGMTVLLRGPQWPGYPVTVRVHEGETRYDQYDPGSTPPLLQGRGWGVYEQGWAFGEGVVAGSQHLAGWTVERGDTAEESPTARTIAALFSAHGHTYELELRYPLGFDAPQGLLTAYSAMVEGLRFDTPPGPSPTAPVRQELGEGPFLSREEALAALGEGENVELLAAELVSEAEARRRGGACSTYTGHSDGVWLLTVRGTLEGQTRTMLMYVDAVTGAKLCGEEIAPGEVATVTSAPTPTPTLDDLAVETRDYPSPDGAWAAEVTFAMPRAGEGGDQYYSQLKVSRTDGTRAWVPVDAWRLWALGYTFPVPVRWSRDGRYLYFTNRAVPDGCALFVNGSDLQRVDLTDGSVTEVMPHSGLWLEISPEETRVAYIGYGERGLVVRDLATGTEREAKLGGPDSYSAGHIVWSPDGRALALTLAIGPCEADNYGDGGIWARSTSIVWVDAQTLELRTLVREDERRFISMGWADGRIALEDGNGNPWWLDAATGELAAGG